MGDQGKKRLMDLLDSTLESQVSYRLNKRLCYKIIPWNDEQTPKDLYISSLQIELIFINSSCKNCE